ncbi:hypothetical protein DLM78_20450 [Leptospira stimsonii]|uniref:Uncharacterized protein n=1 Tax=Leptospira stimsonii TaxID=2202203 RepID=A0A8B3CMM1_9LEPT|nr:hypothetical protein DLM78_20450 [Leptospira stimsonii]
MTSDHKLFNCDEEYEVDYVASLYPANRERVKAFLKDSCRSNKIHHSTHAQVYDLIKRELGLIKS